MKKGFLLVTALLFILAFTFAPDSHGSKNSAPNLDCHVCHPDSGEKASVKITGIPKTYEPGKVYKITITVTSDLKSMSESQGGFAAQASGGQILVTDKKNTQISGDFITHTMSGAGTRTWAFSWKAPKDRTDAELNIMALAANGDYAPTGDAVAAEFITVKTKK